MSDLNDYNDNITSSFIQTNEKYSSTSELYV